MNSLRRWLPSRSVPFTTEELEAGRPSSHQPNLLNPSPVPCCAGPRPVGVVSEVCWAGRGSLAFLNSSISSA